MKIIPRMPRQITIVATLIVLAFLYSLRESISAPSATSSEPRELPPQQNAASLSQPVPVVEVVDGDTLRIMWMGKLRLVRLLGTDAPETRMNPRLSRQAQTHDTTKEKVAEYGIRSHKALKTLVGDKAQVRLEFDEERSDEYGRLLAYVYLKNVMLNREMLRLGYSDFYVFPPNDKYYKDFRRTYQLAKESKRGLWAFGDYEYKRNPIKKKIPLTN